MTMSGFEVCADYEEGATCVYAAGQMSTRRKCRGHNADHVVQWGANSSYQNHPWLVPIMMYRCYRLIILMCMKNNNSQGASAKEIIAYFFAINTM